MPQTPGDGQAKGTRSAGTSLAEPAGQPPAMLVVDDEPQIQNALVRLFGQRFRVLTASRGQEGVELLHGDQFAVIVSDQRMPGMTGAEFLAVAASLQPLASRILMTAYSEIEAVVQAVNTGKVFSYVSKPWRNAELESVVASALEHHQVQSDRERLIGELQQANALLEQRVEERTRALEQTTRELKEALVKLSELALTDSLTGAANRRMLEEVLDREARRGARLNFPLSAILLDLDHFKDVNDSFGHATGDAVLVAVTRALSGSVRAYDLVARYGGEEFVVLLPQADLRQGVAVAERLRRALASTEVEGCPYAVTASFGVACLMPGESTKQLLPRADRALYLAKSTGRDRVMPYTEHDG